MHRIQFVVILLGAYSFQPIVTLPNGAPESACATLVPHHRLGDLILPYPSLPPYRIMLSGLVVYQSQILTIQIEPSIDQKTNLPELYFRGIMIHARNFHRPYQVVSGREKRGRM